MELITHISHRHPLVLNDQLNDKDCSGCRLPIMGPAYVCADCKYFIHESCGELPQQIDHPFHPIHPLTLVKAPCRTGQFYCEVCKDKCSGFLFHCSHCPYNLDIVCASLRPSTHEENHEHRINHFSHQHPLILVTCDEDKHKINCSGCGQPIKGLIYVCFECKFFIHKSCAEVPQQIRHPFHPSHELTLLSKEPDHSFFCHGCHKQSSGFTYNCSECSFDIDMVCSRFKPTSHDGNQDQQINHFSHEHPLTPVPCGEGTCKITCFLCAKNVQEVDGVIYGCFDCKIFIHKSCVELPMVIEDFPFHRHHSLHLRPRPMIVGPNHDIIFFDIKCSFCHELCLGLFVFQCSTCDYFLHLACDKLRPSTSDEQFDRRIQHHCHQQHPLLPFDWTNELYVCSGCEGIIKVGSGYTCPECLFFLCPSCVKLPEKIQHPFHPQHELTVRPSNPAGDFYCIACGEHHWNRFLLDCLECRSESYFCMGLKCASLPTVKYEGHEHPLAFMDLNSNPHMFFNPLKCDTCGDLCRGSFLRCVLCDLNLHIKCIPPLPPKVKVGVHRHWLTLTDPLPMDIYKCDACESTQRNPNHSFYNCAQCEAFAAHIKCGLSQSKVVISWDQRETSVEYESVVFQQLVDAGVDVFQCCRSLEENEQGSGATGGILEEDFAGFSLEEKEQDQGSCSNLAPDGTEVEEERELIPPRNPFSDPLVKTVMGKIKQLQQERSRREWAHREKARREAHNCVLVAR